MNQVIFYEKPGCINNGKQKVLLRGAGHALEVRDLLTAAWTPETLRPFFAGREVREWFNPSSPRIKSGEIEPALLTAETALRLMVADPLLIRRPLIRVGDEYKAGFDRAEIDDWIGLGEKSSLTGDLETCPNLVKMT